MEKRQEEIELIDQNEEEAENQQNDQKTENIEQKEETKQQQEENAEKQTETAQNTQENQNVNQNQNQAQTTNIPQTPQEQLVHYGDEEPVQQAEENTQENEEEEAPKGNIIWRGVKFVGYGLYKIAYSAGEFLADLFGITRPRYEFALNEYYDRERARILRERMERGEVDENGVEIEQPNTA